MQKKKCNICTAVISEDSVCTKPSLKYNNRCVICEDVETRIKNRCYTCEVKFTNSLSYFKSHGNFCHQCIKEFNVYIVKKNAEEKEVARLGVIRKFIANGGTEEEYEKLKKEKAEKIFRKRLLNKIKKL